MADQIQKPIQTKVITNFSGRLTRYNNGDMDSGMAKYSTSFGYDSFTTPGNLTWFEKPVESTYSPSSVSGLITAAKPRMGYGSTTGTLYAITDTSKLYKITPNNTLNSAALTSTSLIATVSVLSGFTYGGGIEFYGSTEQIYLGGDNGVARINFDGSNMSTLGGDPPSSSYTINIPRPLTQFSGNLVFGNGTNIGLIGSGATVTTYGQLSPSLQPEIVVRDLEITTDLNYVVLPSTTVQPAQLTVVFGDRTISNAGDSYSYQWNGIDQGVTAGFRLPNFIVSAVHPFLDNQYYSRADSFGATILDGGSKKLTLPNVRPAVANAISSNGNFLTFLVVEKFSGKLQGTLFYYGQLDDENPPGLWRVAAVASLGTNPVGFIMAAPWMSVISGQQITTDNTSSILATIEGKHLFSLFDVPNGGNSPNKRLYYWAFPSTGTGTPQLGVYETQTQLFSKKITVKQVRVYIEPAVANQGFQLDFIGSDNLVITPGNGVFTWSFTAGTDPTALQGAIERVDYNPAMRDTYALGIRITNTGTANMTIHKIEIDYVESGR